MNKNLAFLLAAVIGLSACAGAPASPASGESAPPETGQPSPSNENTGEDTNEGVTINFYEHSDNETIMAAQIESFHAKNNGIKVVSHIIANADYDDKIKVLVAGGGDALDVFWTRSPAQVMQFAKNNAVQDLSGFAASGGVDLAPIKDTTLVPVTDADGKFYGLPTTGSAWMLFYNKDLFDAAGVEYPVNLTWSQYADLAKQLTGEKEGVKLWGGVYPTWSVTLGANGAGEYLTDESLKYTKEYLQILRRLYTDDKSHVSLEEMSGTNFEVYSVFAGGNVYMMPMGDWTFNLLPGYNPEFTFAAAPFPVLDGVAPESTVGQASYLSISPTSKFQNEAYQFIEFCTATDEGTSIYAGFSGVPCYSTDAAMTKYQEIVKVPGVEYRFSAQVGSETGSESYYGDLQDAFKQEAELYLLDEQSFEDTIENYEELRNEIVSR